MAFDKKAAMARALYQFLNTNDLIEVYCPINMSLENLKVNLLEVLKEIDIAIEEKKKVIQKSPSKLDEPLNN